MSLIVEDGSIVANANSYNDEAAIIAYALARGVVITNPDATKFGILAMDYLSLFSDKWKGTKIDPQDRVPDWPRDGVWIDCVELDATVIPVKIKQAQMQLCIYQQAGVVLVPNSNIEPFVTSEQIGPIKTDYSEKIAYNAGPLPFLPIVDNLLAAYLGPSAVFVRTRRV